MYALLFSALLLQLAMAGCAVMDYAVRDTLHPDEGSIELPGLEEDATIRRDELGIPVVEARNMDDLNYAAGYAMASDRLSQMVSFSLLGQGRLAEMTGRPGLDIDVFIRTLGLPKAAEKQYEQLSAGHRRMLERFSEGVNAYIETHQDSLPIDFKLAGYSPEPWEPINSFHVFNVLNLGLSFNLSEEIAFLNLAGILGPLKAAWLFPVYPDESLPFEKARVFSEARLSEMKGSVQRIADTAEKIERILMPFGTAASNNWAVAPQRTEKGASIVANDTHLPLEHPPVWMLMQLKAPDFHVAGVAMPGIPGIVAGYNGDIAWGMTMVMADTQDLFLERIKQINGKDHYFYKGNWHPVETRTETFHVKGGDPVEKTVKSTNHGPLLNSALPAQNSDPSIPSKAQTDFGLAVSTTMEEKDHTFDGVYGLHFAQNMDEARESIDRVRLMGLNFVYGDSENIAWQVSGRYPVRRSGRGHLPSPGWSGEYDWQGSLPVQKHPYLKNPESGYVLTANNRTVDPQQGPVLGSSWYAPERAGRIRQMLAENDSYTGRDAIAMQYDRTDLLAGKIKNLLFDSPMAARINETIERWDDESRKALARQSLEILREFDGKMRADSSGAALFGIFHHVLTRNLFKDELGPDDSRAWKSFRVLSRGIYGPEHDHLLGRPMSPFWDDVTTHEKIETKSDILAASLADAAAHAKSTMGSDPQDWQWGKIHTYEWRTRLSKMRGRLPLLKRFGAWIISHYTDRGPYPAGGGFNTINVAGYRKGEDFDVWLIPSMRMVVDFGKDEPLFLINSGGQSANPASPHFDDGIRVWLEGGSRQMSYLEDNLREQYRHVFHLKPGDK
ncbi:MAG: penicillin acylase family protein [Desulfobacterales bacterium]